jgi:hypothetical protein
MELLGRMLQRRCVEFGGQNNNSALIKLGLYPEDFVGLD